MATARRLRRLLNPQLSKRKKNQSPSDPPPRMGIVRRKVVWASPEVQTRYLSLHPSFLTSNNEIQTFIFVRPPPAKSNHPLNLQVQLVPPTSRTQKSLEDSDATISLTRTASNRSDTSGYGSTASFSSSTSSASGRRTIIPLYNLQAHNVMTNTIVDAGTDAKIAKFQKRGIELIELAVLEPVEVWGEKPRTNVKSSRSVTPERTAHTARSSTISLSSNTHSNNPPQLTQSYVIASPPPPPPAAGFKRNIFGKLFKKGGKDMTPPASPSSLFFLNSTTPTQSTPNPSVHTTPTPIRTGGTRSHARNLSATLSPTSGITSMLGGRDRSSSPNPALLGQTPVDDAPTNTSTSDLADEKILRPPVLGIQPTLSYSYMPAPNSSSTPLPLPITSLNKNARALMYVWFVKKWLKRRYRPVFGDEDDNSGLLGMVREAGRGAGSFMSGGNSGIVPGEGVEVRFEWKRTGGGKAKARRDRERTGDRRGRQSFTAGPDTPEGRAREAFRENAERDRRASNRLSVISHQSLSTNVSLSEDGHAHSPFRNDVGQERIGSSGSRSGTPTPDRDRADDNKENEIDDGDESDAEDSETPWVCTLKIRRTDARSATTPTFSSTKASRFQGNGTEIVDEMGSIPSANQVLRIKVGTLSPTPHHPKVVAMLKVPFPLPDVEVERLGSHKRTLGKIHLHLL